MHLILLSGENINLARLESESLLGLEGTHLDGNRLYCTIPSSKMAIIGRLAYAKKIYEIMYVTGRKNLEKSLESYPWINVYEKNFSLRISSSDHYDERYYSVFVWKSLEKNTRPKVNLDNPALHIEVFIDGEKATVTRLIYHNFEDFEHRKAHLRPVLHPTTMHPKMARALINILNCDPKEKILDPFCGACGILTEAGLLGLKFEGYDIDRKIINDAKKNMEYYNIDPKHYNLYLRDATKVKSMKNIVTDLPYGKSSKKSHDLVILYAKFLKNISGRAVVVMPNFMPYKDLLKKNLSKSLVVTHIIDHYVHKSLTRKIVLIDVKQKGERKAKESNVSVKRKVIKTKNKTSKSRSKIAQKRIKRKSKSLSKIKKSSSKKAAKKKKKF